MKKARFTLGLALSMLFMGASVSHAANYDNSYPHDGKIKTTVTIKASPYYTYYNGALATCRGINFVNAGIAMHTVGTKFDSYGNPMQFNVNLRDTVSKTTDTWHYGYNTTDPNGTTCDYYFDDITKTYVGNGLFYTHKRGGSAKNIMTTALKMVEGLDVFPVVTRTITYGDWVYNEKKKVNELVTTDVAPIVDILDNTTEHFRPYYDRKTGVAVFVFEDDVIPLLEKHVIYSIDYEISTHSIVGDIAGEGTNPPLNPDPINMRGVTFEVGSGIMTTPSAFLGTHYTPSNQNFTFTVYSNEDITVSTSRGRDKEGVKIEDNENGTYTVSIIKVQSDITVTINPVSTESGTGEDGKTGNEIFNQDAVWGANGTLFVNASKPATLLIYNITGQLYKQTTVSGSFTTSIPKGLYIVQLNGKAYKVVL